MLELPEELVCEIMNHLPQNDLGHMTEVCRDLYRIGTEDIMWRKKGFLKRTSEMAFAGGSDTMPSPRLCHTAVIHNKKLYVYGGHNTEVDSQRFSEVKNDLFTFDLAKKTWEKHNVRNLPAKTEHCTVIHKDKLWMFGGYSGHTFSNSVYMLNLSTNTQCSLMKVEGEVPTGRSAHVGTIFEDKLYIFGGWDGIVQNNDFYCMDFGSMTWKKMQSPELPHARCSHTVAVSEERKSMYIFGGYGGKTRNYLNDLWSFNFANQSWTQLNAKGEVPSPRSRMRMVEWNGKLYVFGGWDKSVHFDELHEYDLDEGMWSKVDLRISSKDDSLKIGQHAMSINDNILYIFGGYSAMLKKSTNNLYSYRLGKPKVYRSRNYEITQETSPMQQQSCDESLEIKDSPANEVPSSRDFNDFKMNKLDFSNEEMEVE